MKLSLPNNQYILTEKGIDISLPLSGNSNSVLAWYCEPIKIEPVKTESFIGEVKQGGSVNFRNVTLNLHGNGTHTECVGHISKEDYSLNQCLREFHFNALLVSVTPEEFKNTHYNTTDFIIDDTVLMAAIGNKKDFKALVVRTLNVDFDKTTRNYSNTNPPYFTKPAIEFLNKIGVDHLLIDLPSVDREVDGGKLEAHHTFWNYTPAADSGKVWTHKTITELVYIPEPVKDGHYLLNIHITSLETDASPSKIVLYELFKD